VREKILTLESRVEKFDEELKRATFIYNHIFKKLPIDFMKTL